MKKKFMAAILSLAIVITLAGCGSGELDGVWMNEAETTKYEFEGNNFIRYQISLVSGEWLVHSEGTFTIIGEQIEFVHSGGRVNARDFSRTPNTFTVGGTQYFLQ